MHTNALKYTQTFAEAVNFFYAFLSNKSLFFRCGILCLFHEIIALRVFFNGLHLQLYGTEKAHQV